MHPRVPGKGDSRQDNCAQVVPELCIMCGNCTAGLPQQRKAGVRRPAQRQSPDELQARGDCLACSFFCCAVPGVRPAQLIHALKKLGFFAVVGNRIGRTAGLGQCLSLMRSEPRTRYGSRLHVRRSLISSQVSSGMPASCLEMSCPLCSRIARCCARTMATTSRSSRSGLASQRRRRLKNIPNFSMWRSRLKISILADRKEH
jgi:hypothetical protein